MRRACWKGQSPWEAGSCPEWGPHGRGGCGCCHPAPGAEAAGPLGEPVLCECRWLPSGVSVGTGEASVTLHGQGKAKGGTQAGSIDDPPGPGSQGQRARGTECSARSGGGDRDLVGVGLRANIPGVELFWV